MVNQSEYIMIKNITTEIDAKRAKLERWKKHYANVQATEKVRIAHLIATEELLDEDGYPTNAAHEIIKLWSYDDAAGWMKFIKSIWYMSSWGWYEEEAKHKYRPTVMVDRFVVSTVGWSGNEGLIRTMREHPWLWNQCFLSEQRGGHFMFEVEKDD
jgi:hypothetical protein